MPGIRLATLVRRLRRDTAADGAGVSDAELLGRFVRTRDEAAFELLVWRHGAMVLGACRRALGSPEDAEDAFQAVFLVLARKAASVSRGAALPAWLHRVALRLSARLARSRRPAAELATDPPAEALPDAAERSELRGVLDAEIDRLPERCRRAVVLCYLEGLSGSEAARLLGCPTGTVESRLAAARKWLRDRLTRRGVTLPVGILAVVGAQPGLAAEVVTRTTRAGVAVARDGMRAAAGLVRDPAVKLAKGALVMASVRTWAGVVLGVGLVAVAAGVGWANLPADPPGEPEATTATPEVAPQPAAKDEPKKPAADAWPLARQLDSNNDRLVGVSPDGRSVIMSSDQRVYGLKTTGPDRRGEIYSFMFDSPNLVFSTAISPDGRFAATAEGSNGVKLRELPSGKVIEALWPGSGLPAEQVAFSPDGSKLIALCTRTETPEGKALGKKGGKGGFDAGFGAADRKSPRYTKRVQAAVWDVASRKELGRPVEAVTADQWLLPEYALVGNGRFVLKTEYVTNEEDPRLGVVATKFTVTDALSGAAGKTVELKTMYLVRGFGDPVSPDGKMLALMGSQDRADVRLIDVASGKERVTLGPLRRPIKAFAFSPDSKLAATATGLATDRGAALSATIRGDGIAAPTEVVIWDAATGKELARLVDKESNHDYGIVRFSPDGSFLVAETADRARLLTVWGHPPAPEPEGEAAQPPGKGKGGKGNVEDEGPVKGKGGKGAKGKAKGQPSAEPTPAAPSGGVPDRFTALFRDLSADGITDPRRVESLFLAALGRLPTDVESRTLVAQISKRTDKADALKDLLATLVETAEFKAHAEALQRLAK